MVSSSLVGAGSAGDLAYTWSAAELAHGDDQRVVQESALGEILQERREGAIRERQERGQPKAGEP